MFILISIFILGVLATTWLSTRIRRRDRTTEIAKDMQAAKDRGIPPLQFLLTRAGQGDELWQYVLALKYFNCPDVPKYFTHDNLPQDDIEGAKWVKKSADKGLIAA